MLMYLSAIGVVFFGSLSFFFFQRSRALQNILSRGASQYDELQKNIEFLKGRVSSSEATNIALQKELSHLKSIHEAETARNAKIVSEFINAFH